MQSWHSSAWMSQPTVQMSQREEQTAGGAEERPGTRRG
eukprot:COSAG01_NODE_14888_length_1396_cov_1.896844_1_plen_37_part_10